jgi:hypothetical protein
LPENSENSGKTLLINEHILKDTHILELNILGRDIVLARKCVPPYGTVW